MSPPRKVGAGTVSENGYIILPWLIIILCIIMFFCDMDIWDIFIIIAFFSEGDMDAIWSIIIFFSEADRPIMLLCIIILSDIILPCIILPCIILFCARVELAVRRTSAAAAAANQGDFMNFSFVFLHNARNNHQDDGENFRFLKKVYWGEVTGASPKSHSFITKCCFLRYLYPKKRA